MSKKVNPKLPEIYKESPLAGTIINKFNGTGKEKTNVARSYQSEMPSISKFTKEKLQNNEDITQLFPDVELAIQILTSSILAPNDMLTTSLIYEKSEMPIPSNIKQFISSTIKTYIHTNYNITDKLSTILREALFTKGAYIEYVIPEASLDTAINGIEKVNGEVSLESYLNNMIKNDNSKYGIIGESNGTDKIKISNEAYVDKNQKPKTSEVEFTNEDVLFSITDNLNIINASNLYSEAKEKEVSDIYGIESGLFPDMKEEDTKSLDKLFKTFNDDDKSPFINIKDESDNERKSIGKPLVSKLPVESVIPVHVSGDPTKHIGYFVLLDERGTPVIDAVKMHAEEDEDRMYIKNDNKLNMIKKAKEALNGITKVEPQLSDMEELYNSVITNKIRKRLSTGKYADIVDINDDNDVYRIMFHRALQSKGTKLLFLPKELVAFYAFDYRANGTGRSMLEKVAMLFSIRSIVMFTNVMAHIKNSVNTTNVSATLEPNDPDPEKTMEKIMSEMMKTRQTRLPLGITKPQDLVDWSNKVGIKYNFKHPSLPDMEIDVTDDSSSKVIPSEELDEKLQEHIIMSFGLTPELVKSGFDPDFATTAIANNILLNKRIIQYQNTLVPLITLHIRKLLINDGTIIGQVKDIIKNNIKEIKRYIKKDTNANIEITASDDTIADYMVKKYIQTMEVSLPKPASPETTNMKDAFTEYKDVLDDYLDMIISEDAFPEEYSGDIVDKLDGIKSMVKTILTKKWMSDNSYMPELNEFMTTDEDGNPVFDILSEYNAFLEVFSKTIIPFIKDNNKIKNDINDKLDKADKESDDDETTDDTSADDSADGDNNNSDS